MMMATTTRRRRVSSASASGCSSLHCVFAVCLMWSVGCTKAVVKLPGNESFPAVLVFGDSIVDTGNNDYITTFTKANFPPYGQDFIGGVATGRFSNGRVGSDILAEELGVKQLVPPYLKRPRSQQDLLTGVCFASGGAGYDPLTSFTVSAMSFSTQLRHFKDYITKLKKLVGEEKANLTLTKSLFVVVAGSNDIANTYYTVGARRLKYNVPAYADFMVNSSSDFLNEIYKLGARRVAVFGAPPVGCVPEQRTLRGGIKRKCATKPNELAQVFNKKLSEKLDSIKTKWPETRMVYIDVYTPFLDLIQNPKKYGFEVADKGCCGTGKLEVSFLCNKYTSKVCSNVKSHVFWDSFHPTENAYRALIAPIAQKYAAKFF